MAKAFFPTNDGHLGNLQKLPTPQILELIKRQEKLMKNRAFLNNLPDKGQKFGHLLEKLNQELLRRNNPNEGTKHSQSPDDTLDTKPLDESNTRLTENKNTPDRIRHERKSKLTNGVNIIENDVKADVSSDVKVDISMDTDQVNTRILGPDHVLEQHFEALSVQDKNSASVTIGGEETTTVKHYYEIAEERAEKNAHERKEPFQLNRTIKVAHFKDMPEIFTRNKVTQLPHVQRLEKPGKPAVEESAAVAPLYKYDKAKMLSLPDSLQLQQQQKQKQEEIQAVLAAEKLSQRLGIKLEPYNPEGVDMSYRNRTGYQEAADSDDDEDDEAAVNFQIVPSDSED